MRCIGAVRGSRRAFGTPHHEVRIDDIEGIPHPEALRGAKPRRTHGVDQATHLILPSVQSEAHRELVALKVGFDAEAGQESFSSRSNRRFPSGKKLGSIVPLRESVIFGNAPQLLESLEPAGHGSWLPPGQREWKGQFFRSIYIFARPPSSAHPTAMPRGDVPRILKP